MNEKRIRRNYFLGRWELNFDFVISTYLFQYITASSNFLYLGQEPSLLATTPPSILEKNKKKWIYFDKTILALFRSIKTILYWCVLNKTMHLPEYESSIQSVSHENYRSGRSKECLHYKLISLLLLFQVNMSPPLQFRT